ncbi:uncharacterized protein LOC124184773 [Neodiprion fabricii]|uniref:uncharacterized protein LOC124184773 n=1 Tax=Neodiprion fabricii TaxID=2872261 RepID=UPI001ED8D715|nr:uncharacterized protein LOC124184773 [Neodiprion fabricii]
MYGKLIILLAVASSLSAQSNSTVSPNIVTTVSTVAATMIYTNSSSMIEGTTASTTNARTAAQNTKQSVANGTRPPGQTERYRYTRRPSGRPPTPPDRVQFPGSKMMSDFMNTLTTLLEPPVSSNNVKRHSRNTVSFNYSDSVNITDTSYFFNGPSLPGFFGVPDLRYFQMPSVNEMVPSLPQISNPQNLHIPRIPDFPNPPEVFGMRDATIEARQRLTAKISPRQDLASGIQNAIRNGLSSSNPTEAMRGLISTILDTYLAVARNCPFLIAGGYLMREGLWLSSVVLRTMANMARQV